MSVPLKILHLEDSRPDAMLIEAILVEAFPEVTVFQVDGREAFQRACTEQDFQVVLSDYSLPGWDGISALSHLRHERPEVPFIFVSGAMGEDMAVECMKLGATDYVLKSNLKRLPAAVRRALDDLDTRLVLTEAARVGKVVPWQWNEQEDTWIFGYLASHLLGYSPYMLRTTPGFLRSKVHVEDLPRFVSAFEFARGCERFEVDCRVLSGDERWLWTHWTLAWQDGRCRGILQDLSELHSAQEALLQSQRLETLGTMIAGIIHDFGNLITAMNGVVQLISETPLSDTQKRHVGLLSRSCARAMDFRRELLSLARREHAPEKVEVDLNDMAQEVVTLLGHALGVSIEIQFEPWPGPLKVYAVPSQLLQVFLNLGINARDAMEGKGRIRFSLGQVLLSEGEAFEKGRTPGWYAMAEMEDTGPGIPPEQAAHVFDSYYTTKRKDKGTGLGLAMVRAITQQHDGIVEVISEPGHGARFRLLLPLASSAP